MQYRMLFLVLLMSIFTRSIWADCHFIRLNYYQLTERPDLFDWGQVTPLIGLEAGRFYNLSPPGKRTSKVSTAISGEIYYIPNHLIDDKQQFSLRMMVIERDTESSDDTILPLREYPISLKPELFIANNYRVDVFFRPFGDLPASVPRNEQLYQFDILKDRRDCSLSTEAGRANVQRYRQENDLKRLNLRLSHYEHEILVGGHEYYFYRLPKIEKHDYDTALKLAQQVASVNSNELLVLGHELDVYRNVKKFQSVWKKYTELIHRLYKQEFIIRYSKDGVWKVLKVPSLGFHPKWKQLTGSTGMRPPKKWKIHL